MLCRFTFAKSDLALALLCKPFWLTKESSKRPLHCVELRIFKSLSDREPTRTTKPRRQARRLVSYMIVHVDIPVLCFVCAIATYID
jgi:hypothetical protein